MKLEVDPYTCVSAGQCVVAAPQVFDQNPDDGRVRLLIERPEPALQGKVDDAVFRCPSQAIEWVED